MILQNNYTIPDMILFSLDIELMIGFIIMLFLLLINVYFYKKMKIPLLIIVIFLFSIIIGSMLLSNEQFFRINYLTYFVIFFMLFQTVLFILIIIKIYEKDDKNV